VVSELANTVGTLRPGPILVDLEDRVLDKGDIDRFARLHAAWRAAGYLVTYRATVPATRGLCVAAMHRAGDLDGRAIGDLLPVSSRGEPGAGRVRTALDTLKVEAQPSVRPSTLVTRAAAAAAGLVQDIQVGYREPFLEHIFRTFAIAGATAVGNAVEASVAALTTRWGERTAWILVAFSSQGRGCPHCSFGFMYAANLMHFRDTQTLGPIDEREMVLSLAWTDAETRRWVQERLASGPWADALAPLEQLWALRDGAAATSDDDRLLVHILAAWTLVTECSLQVRIGEVPPLHPRLVRDRRLQRDYRAARSARETPLGLTA
jgi:hypothetical protein